MIWATQTLLHLGCQLHCSAYSAVAGAPTFPRTRATPRLLRRSMCLHSAFLRRCRRSSRSRSCYDSFRSPSSSTSTVSFLQRSFLSPVFRQPLRPADRRSNHRTCTRIRRDRQLRWTGGDQPSCGRRRGPDYSAGTQRDDVILEVNRQPVQSPAIPQSTQ
jgi:hypothetical protein